MKKSPVTLIYWIMITTIVIACFALSQYFSTTAGETNAEVAVFSVGIANSEEIDIFSTANSENEDVMNGKLLPGTTGQFDIILSNDSDTNVEYVISLEETENANNIPIEYSLDGTNYFLANEIFKQTEATGNMSYNIGEAVTKQQTIYWRWAFTGGESSKYQKSQNAESDTAIGQYSETVPNIKVKINVDFTQQ